MQGLVPHKGPHPRLEPYGHKACPQGRAEGFSIRRWSSVDPGYSDRVPRSLASPDRGSERHWTAVRNHNNTIVKASEGHEKSVGQRKENLGKPKEKYGNAIGKHKPTTGKLKDVIRKTKTTEEKDKQAGRKL